MQLSVVDRKKWKGKGKCDILIQTKIQTEKVGISHMELKETRVETSTVYNGVIVRVELDRAELPNGRLARREVVRHPGGVAILPLDAQDRAITVRQFRYPFYTVVSEVPAGKLEAGEDPREAAVRELSEEVGVTAGEMVYLGSMYPSPGFCDEELHMYLALDLTEGACHPDPDEFLEVERVPFDELVARIMRNEVRDGKTISTVLKAKEYLKR